MDERLRTLLERDAALTSRARLLLPRAAAGEPLGRTSRELRTRLLHLASLGVGEDDWTRLVSAPSLLAACVRALPTLSERELLALVPDAAPHAEVVRALLSHPGATARVWTLALHAACVAPGRPTPSWALAADDPTYRSAALVSAALRSSRPPLEVYEPLVSALAGGGLPAVEVFSALLTDAGFDPIAPRHLVLRSLEVEELVTAALGAVTRPSRSG